MGARPFVEVRALTSVWSRGRALYLAPASRVATTGPLRLYSRCLPPSSPLLSSPRCLPPRDGLAPVSPPPPRLFRGLVHLGLAAGLAPHSPGRTPGHPERDSFIDNRLVRIHFIIVMIRRTGLAPWEFEFPFPGSLTSTFLVRDTVVAATRCRANTPHISLTSTVHALHLPS